VWICKIIGHKYLGSDPILQYEILNKNIQLHQLLCSRCGLSYEILNLNKNNKKPLLKLVLK